MSIFSTNLDLKKVFWCVANHKIFENTAHWRSKRGTQKHLKYSKTLPYTGGQKSFKSAKFYLRAQFFYLASCDRGSCYAIATALVNLSQSTSNLF